VLDAAGGQLALLLQELCALPLSTLVDQPALRDMLRFGRNGSQVTPALTTLLDSPSAVSYASLRWHRQRDHGQTIDWRRAGARRQNPKEREMTRVADVMTRGVRSMSPQDTVVLAAQAMDELNVGVIPVCEGDKLVGMVTDRDIVVRGVAQEADTTNMTLADVMSTNVRCATEDEDVDEVLDEMARNQIRRMPWWTARRHLVGIITLGDIAAKTIEEMDVAHSLGNISEPLRRPIQPVRASGAAGAAVLRATPEGTAPLTPDHGASVCQSPLTSTLSCRLCVTSRHKTAAVPTLGNKKGAAMRFASVTRQKLAPAPPPEPTSRLFPMNLQEPTLAPPPRSAR
jgi:CBS domain-containing protein